MEIPGFIKPQLASLRSIAPTGDQWLHESSSMAYRIQDTAERKLEIAIYEFDHQYG
jgi:hypothetical protein